MPAQRQVGVDPGLQRGQPQLLQAGRLGPGERVVGQVGQHRAAPQLQGPAQRLGRFGVPAGFQRGPARREALLEECRVEVLAVYAQQVAAIPGHQDPPRRAPGAVRLQRPAQVKHVGLDGGGPALGRVAGPDVFGQPVHRYHPVGFQQQQRQHRSLPRAA